VTALGRGQDAAVRALQEARGGLHPGDFADADLPMWIGRVPGLEQVPLEGELTPFDCRNNRLARAALECDDIKGAVAAARERYGANRVGVFLGTSTSGIRATERAFSERDADGRLPGGYVAHYRQTQSPFSVADFVTRYLDLRGPALVVSTACSSSAKVFATAWRHIQAGLCDAALVGGVDSLCLSTLYGFNALELISPEPCRPWDRTRRGISIGEGAGFALLESPAKAEGRVALLGYGESSDAYHISTPHPQGEGASVAMEAALNRAGLGPRDIDYINLHGTATAANDAAEDRAVVRLFGAQVPCSSTKGWTGHTLGAAGVTEAVFCALALERGFIPGTLNTNEVDPELRAGLVKAGRHEPIGTALSNSLGFGGTNCTLLLGLVR